MNKKRKKKKSQEKLNLYYILLKMSEENILHRSPKFDNSPGENIFVCSEK